jgi:hypothetical protein
VAFYGSRYHLVCQDLSHMPDLANLPSTHPTHCCDSSPVVCEDVYGYDAPSMFRQITYIVQGWCSLTGYLEFRKLWKETTQGLGDWIFQDVLCCWGTLTEIVLDNGKHFVVALGIWKASIMSNISRLAAITLRQMVLWSAHTLMFSRLYYATKTFAQK